MSLTILPYEVISLTIQGLDLEDTFHLGLTCRRFNYLIRDNRSCKGTLESHANASAEAQEARVTGQWARALRRLVQRRQSVRAAAPFAAAVVAVAQSWLYTNGVLCHVQDRVLRVLDVHRSAADETVVDVRRLFREALPGAVERDRRATAGAAAGRRGRARKLKFQVVYCAEGLVSCVYSYSRPDAESWLVVFDAREREIVTVRALESTYKLFVRNDAAYLYFGTHSEFGEDGFRRWVLMGYDIKADKWFGQKIHLMDMVGSDIGQSICFEIIDGYFYGLSNQTSFEVDEVDWTSYYHCFRFPVDSPQPKSTQRSVRDKMWRRQHAEGPIDDRWSFLRLLKNEADGRLQILESRKEWLGRRSSGQRAYYTTDLVFGPEANCDVDEGGASTGGPGDGTSNTSIGGNNYVHGPGGPSSSSNYTSNGPGDSSGGGIILNPSSSGPSAVASRTNYYLPTTQAETRVRNPHDTHLGDDATTALLFTFSKCPVRAYSQPSQTFLDLVDNPDPADPTNAPRLQLRAGSRHYRPADELLRLPAPCPMSPPDDDDNDDAARRGSHHQEAELLFKDGAANRITFWPPTPDEAAALGGAAPDPGELTLLGQVVNPPGHVGGCRGAWDERSFVYSTGNEPDGVQALVLLSFDSGTRLQGLRRWDDRRGGGRVCAVADAGEEGQRQGPEAESVEEAGDGWDGAYAYGALEGTTTDGAVGVGCPTSTDRARGECAEDVYGAVAAATGEVSPTGRQGDTEKVVADSPGGNCTPEGSVAGDSPRSGYSSGAEEEEDGTSAYLFCCSSPGDEQQQQQPRGSSIGLQTATGGGGGAGGTCSWAWMETAMYRQIAFGYDHLPDFTRAREEEEARRGREQGEGEESADGAAATCR